MSAPRCELLLARVMSAAPTGNDVMKAPFLFLLILSLGCVAAREYSVAVVNGTQDTISDADVAFGDFHSGGGWLRPGIANVNGSATPPIPDYATVRWRTSDGVLHEERVPVRSVLPRGYHGDLSFTIRPDNTVLVDYDRSHKE
jgi:hypothetical protein